MSPDTLIKVSDPSLLRIRFWDGQCVVYDGISSTTHLIELHAGFLLEWVCQHKAGIACLADRLASVADQEEPDDIQQYVLGAVENLTELGLLTIDEKSD